MSTAAAPRNNNDEPGLHGRYAAVAPPGGPKSIFSTVSRNAKIFVIGVSFNRKSCPCLVFPLHLGGAVQSDVSAVDQLHVGQWVIDRRAANQRSRVGAACLYGMKTSLGQKTKSTNVQICNNSFCSKVAFL